MSIGRFYAMVGALLRRPSDGKYLVLKRSEDKDFAMGSWECVTGRVDQGEGFSEAVLGGVFEELGHKRSNRLNPWDSTFLSWRGEA